MRRNRRTVLIGFGVTLALGLLALLYFGLRTASDVSQTVGVLPVRPVAPLKPQQEVCQDSIGLAEPVEIAEFFVGTYGKPGPAMDVTMRRSDGRVVARARYPGGWPDNGDAKRVDFGHVAAEQIVSFCIRNLGPIKAWVYGDVTNGTLGEGPIGVRPTISTSEAKIDGKLIDGDIGLNFVDHEPTSFMASLPKMFRHADHFRPGFVSPGLFWALALAILVLVPLLLVGALIRAFRTEEPEPQEERAPARTEPERRTSPPLPSESP